MSASREKKNRQDMTAQGPTDRAQKKQQEAADARRSTILYTVVGIICAALLVFLLVWHTGVIQRSAAAVTINGVKYTVSDVQYYYTSLANQYGMSSVPDSMRDYLVNAAVESLKSDAAVAAKAEAEGYTLSDEAKETLDSQIALLDSGWQEYGYSSQAAFIRTNYGPYMTYDKLVALLNRQILASDYTSAYVDSLEYSASDYQTYYKENADTLDSFTITQYVFQARVSDTDDEGNAVELTEEESAAALEEAKTEALAKAEALLAKLEAGEDPDALAEEYSEDLYSSEISAVRLGSAVNSAYSEWAFDSARRAGDTTLAEYDSDSAYNYYVVRFENRALDDAPSRNVRHILIAAETDEGASEPTQAQYEAAKVKAEELLAQWEAGEATEDSFAALAQENSADTSSAANGGLISNVTSSSTYVDTFKDWVLDPARKDGDTGIVQNTGSTVKGWHIMYYVSGDPIWEQTANSALLNQDYSAWLEAAQEGYEADTGLGIKFIQS